MTMPPRKRGSPGWHELRGKQLARAGIAGWNLTFLALAGGLILPSLETFWNANPAYAFGWVVPFLATYLFLERWSTRPIPQPDLRPKRSLGLLLTLIGWGLILWLAELLEETEPGWRPGLWLEMSLLISAILAWCWLYGGRAWLRHFIAPVGFLFLGVPWLFNFESVVVQTLARGNASCVAGSLLLLDLPARASGTTIQLATGRLGVEEACSGIRSLQAVVMMSVFLGEFYLFPLARRFLLLGLAVAFALAGNYARLFFLAWQGAQHGLPSVESTHDFAGWAILLGTVASLWLVCLQLASRSPRPQSVLHRPLPPAHSPVVPARDRHAFLWAVGIFLAATLSQILTWGWYSWRDHSAPQAPEWRVVWPAQAQNLRPLPISAVAHALLRDSESKAASWVDGQGKRWQALWFKYRSSTADKITFETHNPEVCLPAEGLLLKNDLGEMTIAQGAVQLRAHEYLFTANGHDAYVFWIAYLNRGEMESASSQPMLYGHSPDAFLGRSLAWCHDAWLGLHGATAETLEVMISGAPDEADARRAYLSFLRASILVDRNAK